MTKARREICKQVFPSTDIRVKAGGILQNMGVLDKWKQKSSYANATIDILEAPEVAKVRSSRMVFSGELGDQVLPLSSILFLSYSNRGSISYV